MAPLVVNNQRRHCQVPSSSKMCISESLAAVVSTIYALCFLCCFTLLIQFQTLNAVSEGVASLIQGSYEYYHYLQDSFDDSVYIISHSSMFSGTQYLVVRLLILIIYRLFRDGVVLTDHCKLSSHGSDFNTIHPFLYLHIGNNKQFFLFSFPELKTHNSSSSLDLLCITFWMFREIQQTLVEIGDKDPSFVGSREWIGAIELSFVLDKLLGVSLLLLLTFLIRIYSDI